MNGFLIITPKGTSEWMSDFEKVQETMNVIEKSGNVSDIKVCKFENNKLINQMTYDFNGEYWEKRK